MQTFVQINFKTLQPLKGCAPYLSILEAKARYCSQS